MIQEYYTPEELSEQLKLNRMTIYRLLRRGEIPSIRVGKSYRIPADELEDWFALQKGGTTAPPIIPRAVEEFIRLLEKGPKSLKNKILRVVLFGSYARGTPHEKSDADLLVIEQGMTDTEEDLLLDMTSEAELKCEDDISLMTKSVQEWERMRLSGSGLCRVIQEEGLSLWPTRQPMKSLIEIAPSKR